MEKLLEPEVGILKHLSGIHLFLYLYELLVDSGIAQQFSCPAKPLKVSKLSALE